MVSIKLSEEIAEALQARHKKLTREDILKESIGIVMGDRADSYGDPEDNFNLIADFWNSYINSKDWLRVRLDGKDVAIMMSMLKIARIATGEYKADNYVDLVGYGACAGELANKYRKR